jgi:hypothetical protein
LLFASKDEVGRSVVEGDLRKVAAPNRCNIRIHISVGIVETET